MDEGWECHADRPYLLLPPSPTLEIPEMMMVLFFRGDFSFSFEDSLSCRMATSATGSDPFSTSSSARRKGALSSVAKLEGSHGTRGGGGVAGMVCKQWLANTLKKEGESKGFCN